MLSIIPPNPSKHTRYLTISVVIMVLVLITPVLLHSHAQTKSPYIKSRLLEALRKNKISKELSDSEMVAYIDERGVDFEMTEQDEVNFRNAGAGNEIIGAIARNYRLPKGFGSLTVTSAQPGCRVFLDGQLRGVTSEAGQLRVRPLKAGLYRVILKKESYEDQERVITLGSGADVFETFSLKGLKGTLTVTPNIAGAVVSVQGNDYSNGVTNLALEPGSYNVRVSKEGYKSVDRTVTIEPGRPLSISVILEVYRVEDMLKESTDSFYRKNYPMVIAKGREILVSHPDNAQATLLVGLAYYYSDQYSDSVEYLTKAITLGEQVVLPIKHHHAALLSDDLCTGRITVGRGTLAFSSTDRGGHDFIVPANKIYELKFEPNKAGRVHVRVGIQKGTKEDKKTYNFQVIHAYLIPANPNDSSSIKFVRCNNCNEETQVIHQLLKQLKDFPYQPSTAAPSNKGGAGLPTLKPRADAEVEPKASRIPQPSATFRPFNNAGKFTLTLPDNWKEFANSGQNIIFGPDGALTKVGTQSDYSHGVQVGIYPAQGAALPQVFEQFINRIIGNGSYLQRLGANQSGNIKGRSALSVPLGGKSPVSQRDEFIRIYAVLMKNGDLFYLIAVAPQEEASAYAATFGKIIGSIEFLD